MKKIVGIIVIILMIPVIISIIGDIDRTPVYPSTEFNIEKLTRISSLDIENNIELLKLSNNVGDRWLSNGSVERNVGKYIIQDFDTATSIYIDRNVFRIELTNFTLDNNVYVDGESIMNNSLSLFIINSWNSEPYRYGFAGNNLYISLPADYIESNYSGPTYINRIKSYLNDFPITLYYQLTTPILENAPTLPEFIDFYDGGSVIIDDGIIDYTVVENRALINYIEGNITTVVDNQFKISKPTKIISKSNDLYDYDLFNLPNYIEYGTLPTGTYDNVIEFINNNQNKQIKIFYDDNIQENRYKTYLENDTIIIINDIEVIRIYNNDTYTSTRDLDTDITYKLEGYNILEYIDGEFDNTVLAFFWIIPVLLAGGLFYLLLKRKE